MTRLLPSASGSTGPLLAVILLATAARTGAQEQTRWRAYADSAERARLAADWPSYARLVDSIYFAGLGNHPSILWARSRASARLGRQGAVLARLRTYAATGLTRDIDADSAFLSLVSTPDGEAIRARLVANASPPFRSRVFLTIPDSAFVPESIVYDASADRFLVSSVRHGVIVPVASDGTSPPIARSAEARLGGMYGLALDPRRKLVWARAQQIPLFDGFVAADSGRAAIAAFDLTGGGVRRRLAAPDDGAAHAFGDLAVLWNGTVLVSDAASGAIFVAGPADGTLRTLVPAGRLVSPQGIAPAAGDRAFYVADYALGIVLVDTASGNVQRLARPDSIVVSGIDGLIRVGTSLIGVQNGTTPKRIIRLDLDPAGHRIVGSQVLESNPDFLGETTHLTHRNGTIYFMARTGYDEFGEDGKLKAGVRLRRPVVGAVGMR